MTYPESANVSAGDATLASHYNNLRADGVYLGQIAADSVPLGTLLERYESRLEVERLDTTKIRVPASAAAPVSLLIDGYLCQAIANVDLDAGEVPAGGANAYYIFANRADGSTTFTLTVSTSSTEAANQRRIGRFYWDGTKIIKDSVRSEHAGLIADLLYFIDPQTCNGRLTLSTGVPVPVADVASSGHVYFTPYLGNRIALYVQDYGWRIYTFTELTLDISGLADEKNIDVWLYDNAGVLTLAFTEWSNDTLRATALAYQDGIPVKTGALGYRYLGTVRTSGAGVACDTLIERFVWNYYNRVNRNMRVREATAAWTYGTGVWRQVNAAAANRLDMVIGVNDVLIRAEHTAAAKVGSSGESARIGIGVDAVDARVTDSICARWVSTSATFRCSAFVTYAGYVGIGFHYVAAIEYGGTGTTDFYGDDLYQMIKAVFDG